MIAEFLCLDRHMSITPLLLVCFCEKQVTEIQNTTSLILPEPQWQQKSWSRSGLLHICYWMLTCTREELIYFLVSDRARMFLFLLVWNQPLPTLLEITPVNKKADLVIRTLLWRSMPVPPIQAYNILLFSVFLRTMWRAADLSSVMYKHVALATCTSLISFMCGLGCELGGKDGREQVCGSARESSFSFQLPESNSRTHSKYKKHDLWGQAGFRSSTQHYSIYQIVMPGLLQWFYLLGKEKI